MPATRRVAAALLTLLLPALLGGCGILSRDRDAYIGLYEAMQLKDPAEVREALTRLRSSDPLVAGVWMASAEVAGSPEQALEMVERGLQFLPQSSDLLVARLSLLAQLERRDDELAASRATLAVGAPTELRAEALWFMIDGLLAQDHAFEAEAEALRMRALPFSRPEMAASAWARIALAHELAGRDADADRTLDASLDLGPQGLQGLRRLSMTDREAQAAADALVERAVARHPDLPDLQLYLIVDQMAAGDLTGAAAALDKLPEPLPERLVAQREALRARILLLQGHTEAGLDVLRTRLTAEPGDVFALGVLLEAWHVRHVPAAAEMIHWLRAARGKIMDPMLAAQVDATLRSLIEASRPAEPAPPAEPEKPEG